MHINFPKAKGRYWFLYFIGPVTNIKNDICLKFCFANWNSSKDDYYKNNNVVWNKKVSLVLPLRSIASLSIGSIYDSKKNKILRGSSYIAASSIVNISHSPSQNTESSLPKFLNCSYQPLDFSFPLEGYKYYSYCFQHFSKDHSLHISSSIFLRFFLFSSYKIVDSLLRYELMEIFDLDHIKIMPYDPELGVVGELRFRSNKLATNEAEKLAPYLFLKSKKGVHFIQNAILNLRNGLINTQKSIKYSNKIFLDCNLPFLFNCTLSIAGKHFRNEDENYFYAYEIVDCKTSPNEYLVDHIKLIDTSVKGGLVTEEDSISTKIGLKRYKGDLKNITSKSSNSNNIVTDENVNLNNFWPDDLTLECAVENTIIDTTSHFPMIKTGESSYLIDDFSGFDVSQINVTTLPEIELVVINRGKYLKGIVDYLNTELEVNYSFQILSNSSLGYGFYRVGENTVAIVKLVYKTNNYYLIEFEFGNTGFLYHRNKISLSPETLLEFAEECFYALESKPSKRVSWNWIQESLTEYSMNKGIRLMAGIAHCTKQRSELEIIKDNALRIYDKRILMAN